MKCLQEILTSSSVHALLPSATVLEAAQKMDRERVGAILVVDEDGCPVGMFTERDLMVRVVVARRAPDAVRLEEVMTRELFTATPERRINDVAREMQERHIRHLPIVRDGAVLGMLSLRDLLREHLDVKRQEVRDLTAYVQGEGEGPRAPA